MRIVTFFLLSIFFLLALLTGIGLFLPSRVTVSRAIDLQVSRAQVLPYIADIRAWAGWMPGADQWEVLDQGQGAAAAIKTPQGKTLRVVAVSDSSVLIEGFQAASIKGNMGFNLLSAGGDAPVTVQWFMNFEFGWFPWERFSSLLLESRYGLLMEQGLRQLQQRTQSPD